MWGTAAAILAITLMIRDKAQEDIATVDELRQAEERGEELDMKIERQQIKRYIAEVVKEMYDAEDGETK